MATKQLSFVTLALFCCQCSVALADGGTLRWAGRSGNYQLAIFTDPSPPRVGPVDVSILVLESGSGAPVDDAKVTVTATCADTSGLVLRQRATVDAATNKLLRAALLDVPQAGAWKIDIHIEGPLGAASETVELQAGERLPPALALWPWYVWPVIPIGIFIARQFERAL